MIRSGNCHCGCISYQVEGPLGPVANCHCSFCRRIHGAAFTTVVFAPTKAILWLPSSGDPSRFETPLGNVRQFCGRCASPTWNFSPSLGIASIVVGSLEESQQPSPWFHVNTESKAPWYEISDDLPQYIGWPSPVELRRFVSERGAWLPPYLEDPAA